jgi:rhamnosyltransferase
MASGKAVALSGHLRPSTSVKADPTHSSARAICAVMVTCHPDSDLFHRVEKIVPQVSETLIVDNGSSASCVDQLKKISERLGVHLILNSANEGLARAINQGAQWAASRGYQWILMLDQDTTVAPDMVESLGAIVRSDPDAQRLAVVGSNFKDKVTGRLSTTVARPWSYGDGDSDYLRQFGFTHCVPSARWFA